MSLIGAFGGKEPEDEKGLREAGCGPHTVLGKQFRCLGALRELVVFLALCCFDQVHVL